MTTPRRIPHRIAVVGGSGFLGTEICRLLERSGIAHTVCDRVEPRVPNPHGLHVLLDIRDREALERAFQEHDAVIHLAAEWNDVGVPEEEYESTNVRGTENVAWAAEKARISTILFASSASVYDFADARGPVAEEDVSENPPSIYGRTKRAGERVLREWRDRGSDRILRVVRPSVIHGPNNRGNVFNLMRVALRPFFVFPGGRNVVKSIAFVENVATLFLWLLETEVDESTFNYCDEPALSTYEVVRMVRHMGGRTMPLLEVPASPLLLASLLMDVGPARLRDRFGSMKVKKFLGSSQLSRMRVTRAGFVQSIPTEEGLRRTLEWVQAIRGG